MLPSLAMRVWRRFAPVAVLASLHASALSFAPSAFADAPKPSGVVARQGPGLIARGQSLFDDQQYEESIQTLSGALVRPNNTKAQKQEIYRLLALNYITLNHKDEAEAAVRGLLSLDPTYELPARESPRFRDFFATVKQRWEAEGRPGLVKDTEAPPAPVTMKHSSPSKAEPSTQIDLTATLDDPRGRVKEVKLYYRKGSSGKFEEAVASLDGVHVSASIPPSAVKGPVVEYYLQGTDGAGLPVVSRGDAAAPFRIPVPEGGAGWVLPVAIGGSVLGAAAIVGVLALTGVFKGSNTETHTTTTGPTPPPGNNQSTVNVSVSSHGFGARW
jgi:hypothetical protein